ncbi:hypothetical protein C8Q74DRAFT_1286548 [Fomes fomentarius]|nr:hypothetical protein C8Q74DRAFT_1286548 [Fomes fomentarius]
MSPVGNPISSGVLLLTSLVYSTSAFCTHRNATLDRSLLTAASTSASRRYALGTLEIVGLIAPVSSQAHGAIRSLNLSSCALSFRQLTILHSPG